MRPGVAAGSTASTSRTRHSISERFRFLRRARSATTLMWLARVQIRNEWEPSKRGVRASSDGVLTVNPPLVASLPGVADLVFVTVATG